MKQVKVGDKVRLRNVQIAYQGPVTNEKVFAKGSTATVTEVDGRGFVGLDGHRCVVCVEAVEVISD